MQETTVEAPKTETSTEEVTAATTTATTWPVDPNEPRYCLCNDVSYGDMVGCDNADVSTFLCFLHVLIKTIFVMEVACDFEPTFEY